MFDLLIRWAILAVAVAVSVPRIEDDLTNRVENDLAAAGVEGVTVDFDGQNGTMSGPGAQREAALAAVTDRSGIRSLEYESTGSAAPPTTPPPGQRL